MNPQEQHERHIAIGRLDDRIDALAEAVDAEVAERVQEIRLLIMRLLTAEHGDRLVADQRSQLVHLDLHRGIRQNTQAVINLNFYTSQFVAMTLRERLWWVVLGRLPVHISEFPADPEAALFLPCPANAGQAAQSAIDSSA